MLTAQTGGGVLPTIEQARVTLLIPARNEERNIASVLRRVPASVDEVIVVDGRSTDRTAEVVKLVRPDARVVAEVGRGKGAAVRTGIAEATGHVIVMIDADGSMDPGEIDAYLKAIEAGADLVKGSRFLPGGGTTDITPIRMLGNRVLLGLTNRLYSTNHTELCYGYMGFRTEAIRRLALVADGFEIETEIVVRSKLAGLNIVEVPSHEASRLNGESNLNATRDGLRVLRTIVGRRLERSRPEGRSRVVALRAVASAVASATLLGIVALGAAFMGWGQ
jgi:glycosyltransferase involved in cell wall biosynthesis